MFDRIPHLFTLIAAAGLIACGAQAPTAAIDQPFGGMDTSDELTMFGEEETFDDLGQAAADPVDDSTGDATEAAAQDELDASIDDVLANLPDAPRVFAIRLAWGQPAHNPEAEARIPWNPTVSTDCGVLGVRRLVRMEDGEGVVRPRTDAQTVSFRSTTGPHHDGAVLFLAVPASGGSCTAESGLTITAGDASVTIPYRPGFANLTARHDLPGGNVVAIMVSPIEPPRADRCVRGMLVGRWVRGSSTDDIRGNGAFYGRVLNELGDLIGHAKGIYGIPSQGRFAGKPVYFGKLIERDGTFAGLIAGRAQDGKLLGGWHLSPEYSSLRGLMAGRYAEATDSDVEGGMFRALYASAGCRAQLDAAPLAE